MASRRNDLVASLNNDRLIQQASQLEPNDGDNLMSDGAADPGQLKTFVWGTNVDPNESINKFRDFLVNFTIGHRKALEAGEYFDPAVLSDEDRRPYYPRILEQHFLAQNFILNLDCQNLKAYSPAKDIYDQVIAYPQEIVLNVMDFVVSSVFQDLFRDRTGVEDIVFKVRPFNLGQTINLRELDPKDIDKLVSIKGFVLRISSPIPELKIGFFECNRCGHQNSVPVENGRITEPGKCGQCTVGMMQMVYSRCEYYDKQIIRLQETPDSVPAGQTPHTVSLVAYDELVDCVKPGDRVEVTGIFKAMPSRLNPRQRITRSIFKTYIDVLHVKSSQKKRVGSTTTNQLEGDYQRIEQNLTEELDKVSPAMLEKIREIARDPRVFDRLASSLAPSIFGHVDAKKSVLLQLFGGTNKTYAKAENAKHRGNIHVLLCGDPATSKSQILMYVHRLAPRGLYTSGKGSSAVGLTASVSRDPETKQLVLESGALVLSDGGICCIDEFDKMSESTRSILHEAMEQQTVSIAKAGIITTLNARTSILAAANPLQSKWNRNISVVKNLNLPPTLLSRFDIVYLMLDEMNESTDTHLAKHILSLYIDPEHARTNHEFELIDIELYAAYIAYARSTIFPRMDDECINMIAEEYVKLRKVGAMSATTRQLEAIIRLSESHAKMRLSLVVEKKDVDEAVRLIYAALRLSAMDPVTGLLDPDLLITGTSSRERKEAADLRRALSDLLQRKLRTVGKNAVESLTRDELMQELRQQTSVTIRGEDFDSALSEIIGESAQMNMRNNTISFDRI